MNPHVRPPISPRALWSSLCRHRRLLFDLTRREVLGRYQGTVGGITWSFLQPLLTLLLFTFVFSTVLKLRWPGSGESSVQFALVLFAGLLLHALLAEIMVRAPGLVVAQRNYVKRVVFPLELLPIASALGVLLHVLIQQLVWLLALAAIGGVAHWSMLWAPLLLLPLFVLALGLGWLLAALTPFLRDIAQLVPLLSAALLFLAPVFYPLDALPESMQPWFQLNPLSFVVDELRAVVIDGRAPRPLPWLAYSAVALATGWIGYALFQRLRPGFADEL